MTDVHYQKHPRGVQTPDPRLTELANAGLPDTGPSGQVLSLLTEVADWAIDFDTDETDSAALAYRLAVKSGYQPPAADFSDRWQTLLQRMTDFRRWVEAGPDAGEQDLTEDRWNQMIRDELVAIAGRPL